MTELSFADLWLSKELLDAIEKKGYKTPSPIQAWVIPLLLNWNKDIIWQAQTWTWKTASFWLPILDRIDENLHYTQAIIMTPTRELAIQVAEELKSFAVRKRFDIALLYWGQSFNTEIANLRKKPQIVIWTPWRIKDHLSKWRLDLSQIEYFVLDEADEMLNVWFREEIEEILESTRKEKKVLLFSATMPKSILDIVKKYMWEYDLVSVKSNNITNSCITQKYYFVDERDKFEALCRVIETENEFYWILFCQRKLDVDEVASSLLAKWYKAEWIHGDVDQKQRERVLQRFKDKKVTILVATDVAARWIDVNDLTHVINYSLPDNPETYTHRIGRTGRAWKNWIAISFVSRNDKRKLFFIENIIKQRIDKHDLPKVEELIEIKKKKALEKAKANIDAGDLEDYHDLAKELLTYWTAEDVVAAVLKKLYKNEFSKDNYKEIFSGASFNDRNLRVSNSRWNSWEVRLFIARGRFDSFRTVPDVINFIQKETWMSLWDVWKVDILDKFSYMNVAEDKAEAILRFFKDQDSIKPVVVRAKEEWSFSTRWSFGWGERRWWWDRGSRGGFSGKRSDYRSSFRSSDRWERWGFRRNSENRWGDRGWYRGRESKARSFSR